MSRITEIRESEGLSMNKFADRLGVSHAAISLLERGQRNLTPQMAKLISKEFNINEDWLLDGSGEMRAPRTPDDDIADLTSALFKEDPGSLKYKMIMNLAKLDDKQVEFIKNLVLKLADGLDE